MMEKPTDAAMEAPTAMMEKPTDAAMEAPTAMMEKPTDAAMEAPTAMAEQPTAMVEQPMAMADLAPWQKVSFTNVRSGESFTLADFAGRPVYVETMATWCPKCHEQLGNVQSAAEQLGEAGPVFIAISVETELSAAELARYAEKNGFGMIFAVATPEALVALTEAFGRTITNPPATPHFLIRADGTVGELQTGIKSTDALLASFK
jgi:thiol-disulfide isomerase/thioredoxin